MSSVLDVVFEDIEEKNMLNLCLHIRQLESESSILEEIWPSILIHAIKYQNLDAIDLVIEQGVDINGGNSDGITPLMVAAQMNHIEALIHLLKHNVDIHARDSQGHTALMHATKSGSLKSYLLLSLLQNERNS